MDNYDEYDMRAVQPKKKEISAGKQVRQMFANAIEEGKITSSEATQLMDASFSKTLRVRFPFLKLVDKSIDIKQQLKDAAGKPRYNKSVFTIDGEDYLMTNDIFDYTVELVRNYIAEL